MFRDEVGMTPARYVEHTRLEAAKVLLVTGEEGQESVARRAGFGSPETMRRIFRRNLGVSPGSYRSRFRTTGIDSRGRSPPGKSDPAMSFARPMTNKAAATVGTALPAMRDRGHSRDLSHSGRRMPAQPAGHGQAGGDDRGSHRP
ncbi:helix-turn-helix domain-containing protein [Streptomyces sp. NPDC004270]